MNWFYGQEFVSSRVYRNSLTVAPIIHILRRLGRNQTMGRETRRKSAIEHPFLRHVSLKWFVLKKLNHV